MEVELSQFISTLAKVNRFRQRLANYVENELYIALIVVIKENSPAYCYIDFTVNNFRLSVRIEGLDILNL